MMLEKAKLLLGITDSSKDDLLGELLAEATNEAVDYTNCPDPEPLEDAIVQMAVFKYNQIGTEGVLSESYSGASYRYARDYPKSVYRALNAHRKLRCL